jgi:hypothetical protein
MVQTGSEAHPAFYGCFPVEKSGMSVKLTSLLLQIVPR